MIYAARVVTFLSPYAHSSTTTIGRTLLARKSERGESTVDANATIDALIGMVMPALIALVNQPRWSPMLKGLVAFVACVIVAVIVEAWRGDIDDWAQWRETAVIIFGSAIVTYQTWWKPAGIAPTIERGTSSKRQQQQRRTAAPAARRTAAPIEDIEPPPRGEL